MIPSDSHEKQWNAVRDRDAASNGAFVYAVRTTGVYCLPSCSSRTAKRRNVRFFATPAEAESAGFRACKRCKPDQPLGNTPHGEAIKRACNEIQSSPSEPTLASLARIAGLSTGHFQRIFKAEVGLSPKRYAMAVRKQRFLGELAQASSVTHAIYDAGYSSSSRAYADGNGLGMAPGSYQKGAKGEKIRFASAPSSLGDIIVASTDRGICMVEFGDKDDLVEVMKTRFPQASLEPADDTLADLVAKVVSLIDAPADNVALPIDIRGTAFQERVWRALREIPMGRTVSYAELAKMIDQPTAARAVARACAANHIAVVIPCHRVVRASGEISGYKWGRDRKRALLDREVKSKRKPV
ncbi:MAG: bifunctional DNA-binding transcriptional regulator/O6-methylguanine-DNA methyltransferase Ada [Proteobacteria bacterium]|nr:bifunctional DNA-binding transcriptional regulator/O6-methylguanine-DNA methyltransferase Ada [Pseudomonadota bacterium]MDA1022771.1 bifunctional DNA-binding transcriptional regulator/O6-methylguanine-DNA methyltransferase Ada [Pseudomonadota bacterium]